MLHPKLSTTTKAAETESDGSRTVTSICQTFQAGPCKFRVYTLFAEPIRIASPPNFIVVSMEEGDKYPVKQVDVEFTNNG
jgi:hypothetical protein